MWRSYSDESITDYHVACMKRIRNMICTFCCVHMELLYSNKLILVLRLLYIQSLKCVTKKKETDYFDFNYSYVYHYMSNEHKDVAL